MSSKLISVLFVDPKGVYPEYPTKGQTDHLPVATKFRKSATTMAFAKWLINLVS